MYSHADFADEADFFGLTIFYIPQISQIYTDFSSDNSAKSYEKKSAPSYRPYRSKICVNL